jgi:hypothetical protein
LQDERKVAKEQLKEALNASKCFEQEVHKLNQKLQGHESVVLKLKNQEDSFA